MKPKIMLFDEPTSALDPEMVKEVLDTMDYYDDAILNAIEHHTLGDSHSRLALIIYIADKIEPGRGYDTSRHMQLAYHDLHACSELIHQESIEYRKNKEGVHE